MNDHDLSDAVTGTVAGALYRTKLCPMSLQKNSRAKKLTVKVQEIDWRRKWKLHRNDELWEHE